MSIEVRTPFDDSEWRDAFRILKQLRPNLDEQQLFERRQPEHQGYYLLVLLVGDRIRAAGGGFFYPHLLHGKDFWVLDLVTEEGRRSIGYGLRLLQEFEALARSQGCHRLCVSHRNGEDECPQLLQETRPPMVIHTQLFSRRSWCVKAICTLVDRDKSTISDDFASVIPLESVLDFG